jgi:hypothetical protein
VKRYLTQNPELLASAELLELRKLLTKTKKDDFMNQFQQWEEKWTDFLKERSQDKRTGKSYYIHKRLWSIWLSLKRNSPYLWAF